MFLLGTTAGVALRVYRGVVYGGVTGLGWGTVRGAALMRGWRGGCKDTQYETYTKFNENIHLYLKIKKILKNAS